MAKWIFVGGSIHAFSVALLTKMGFIKPSPMQQFIAGLILLGMAAVADIWEG